MSKEENSAAATPPSHRSIAVAPPPAVAAPSFPPSGDDAPIQKEKSTVEGNTTAPVEGEAAPHAAASASNSGIASGDGASSNPSPSQRSRRSTANYHQDYSSEGIISSDEEATSDPVDSKGSGRNSGAENNDIIVSMTDANYKLVMFSFFQKLGTKRHRDRDVDQENRVKDEVYALFKNSGRRLMSYVNHRRPQEGLVELNEENARFSKCVYSISWYFRPKSFVQQSLSSYTSNYVRAQKSAWIFPGGWSLNIIGIFPRNKRRELLLWFQRRLLRPFLLGIHRMITRAAVVVVVVVKQLLLTSSYP